ncbi:inner membrane transporter RhtA [Caulobacter ginsengisoli]|uniref:Inner membrane transporter RhtA n=1 Tax=Caulobacter ginsengisoli TaxID=400775 RepID=A0ABU0IQ05_9CAUL|nr:EamA family transporter [Caulobacter ginsengisoli]MDQ0463094.1 inner membrane transporter RhtA [Caulobacter ginsengisoli]
MPLGATMLAMAGFQVGASLAKGLFPATGVVGAVTLRLVFSAVLLIALTRPWRNWPRPAPLGALFGLGVCVTAAVLFFYLAIDRLPQGVAIALQFVGPMSVAVLGSRRTRDFVWAGLAVLGVWLLIGTGLTLKGVDPLGVLWAMLAAAGWAGYILFGRVAGTAFGNATAALAIGIAALLVLPFGALQAAVVFQQPGLIPLALLVAVISAALPFSLEMYALPRVPARTFAVFTSLEPAFGVLSGLVLLHERLTLAQTAGVAVVIAAAAGAAWSSAERPQLPAPT